MISVFTFIWGTKFRFFAVASYLVMPKVRNNVHRKKVMEHTRVYTRGGREWTTEAAPGVMLGSVRAKESFITSVVGYVGDETVSKVPIYTQFCTTCHAQQTCDSSTTYSLLREAVRKQVHR